MYRAKTELFHKDLYNIYFDIKEHLLRNFVEQFLVPTSETRLFKHMYQIKEKHKRDTDT